MAIYNTIGKQYNSTRKADKYIANKMMELLAPDNNGIYVDIGCGTGNYLKAFTDKGHRFYGIDPSETMLEKARLHCTAATLVQAHAEQLPIADGFFNGATAMFTLHHWTSILTGLQEVNRVLKPGSKMVIFSITPDQLDGYWLQHYFPKMIEKSKEQIPGLDAMYTLFEKSNFKKVTTENYFVHPELEDHFLYSNKYRPDMYLRPEIRANVSSFSAYSEPAEVERGLKELEADIASGAIQQVIKNYENDRGDYIFFMAEK